MSWRSSLVARCFRRLRRLFLAQQLAGVTGFDNASSTSAKLSRKLTTCVARLIHFTVVCQRSGLFVARPQLPSGMLRLP